MTTDPQEQALRSWRNQIDARLDMLSRPQQGEPDRLHQAIRYSLLSPGKRVRPLLIMAVAAHLGCPPRRALDVACAFEMMHASSLIYDDLPSMDDDDVRRGRPALHRKYSEPTAILAAISLMNRAYEVIAHCATLSDPQKVALSALLAKVIGAEGLCAGQYADLHEKDYYCQASDTERMHFLKTGILFVGSACAGARVANASAKEEERMRQYAHCLGLAFQLKDDLSDELLGASLKKQREVREMLEDYIRAARSFVEDREDSPLLAYLEMVMQTRRAGVMPTGAQAAVEPLTL
jgi:geranylgeranyl diphosphate synthase type II